MTRAAHRPAAHQASRALRVFIFLALACLLLPWPAEPAQAAGSRSVTQGWRPYIEWHNSATSGDILRQTTIKAFARAGEQIFLGSSALGIGPSGNIRFRSPAGATGDCRALAVGQPAGYGLIANLAQEQAGPRPDNPAGYIPCVIPAAQTTAAGDGVWEFDFISPNPGNNININPPPLLVTAPWTQEANRHWTNAWDISVRDATTGQDVPGRVFAKYLAYNMGNNSSAAQPTLGLNSQYWIVTIDGYGYRVNMNGIDPFGFIFFSNAEGVVDVRGIPTYRSFQLVGTPPNVSLPTGYSVYNPGLPDDIPQGNVTHKIFFEEPDLTLPATARSPSGPTWLLPATEPPPTVTNFRFTGVEGTPGQGGTAPLGGNFTFDAPAGVNFRIIIDVDANGTYGDNNDRILSGRTFNAANIVYWDALDGAGAPVPAGTSAYNAAIQVSIGEVHFPFIDAENNRNGIQLVRFRGNPGAADADLVYYNDDYTYNGTSAYDYSPCAFTGDAPAPPAGSYPAPLCFGVPSSPRDTPLGVRSTDPANPTRGAHEWSTNAGSPAAGFGDRRLIDTWAFFTAPQVPLIGSITLAQAELSIVKTHSPAQLIPGRPMTYNLRVTNAGPSPAVGARVADEIPLDVQNPSWTCAITTGTGTCGAPSGSGSSIDTTVNLNPGAVATYTIQGLLSPTVSGSLSNIASVRRPNDNTDPNPANNVSINNAPILPVADLELNKSINTPPPIAANTQVEFAIELRNRGPVAATGVEVAEQLPAGLAFVSATATRGSYSAASGTWAVGTMPVDELATLTIRALWNGSPVRNTAQVSKSDQTDPDSTPGNGVATEDDQASASLPVQISDLELTKVASAPRVNVGTNVTFTIAVTNRGPDGATGVRVSEELPPGLGFVRATPSQGSYTLASRTWAVGSLASGASATLQIVATVLGPGPFVNTAQISGSDQYDPDSDPNNDKPREDDQGFSTVAGDIADLSLSKNVDNTQPPFNSTIAYTVVLRNDGPSGATGVAVTERLPAGLTFVSATPSVGSYSSTTGLWQVGALAANGSATLTIRAAVVSGAPIRNTAQVSASDQPDPDSTPGNNDQTEDDQASVTLTPQLADLSLTKVVNNATPSVGGEVTFTIAVRNDGPSAASGVEVSEQLPPGLIYVSHTASRGAYNPSSGIWTIGGISLSEVVTLDLRVRLSGVGPYTNTAEISKTDQPDPDSTPGGGSPNDDDKDTVTIGGAMADLSLVKRVDTPTLPASGIVNFTIEVRNSGPSPATGVTVGERLPAGATVVTSTPSKGSYNAATATWAVGALAVGERATLTLATRLVGPGPFTNVAEVTGSDQFDPDSAPGNGVAGEDDQASASVNLGQAPPPGVADLRLTKSAVTLGKLRDSAAFLITVVNDGPDAATNVEVSERLHPALSFISAAPSQGSYSPATGTWVIGRIPRGGVVTLQIFTLITSGATITNTAQVSRSDQIDPDSTPGNGAAGEDDQASVSFSRTTAITLTGFSAERQAKGVLLSWTTGLEIDSLGFQLYRSASGSRDDAELVTPQPIMARGGAAGASYSFLDAGAEPGVGYSYWLVERSRGGGASEHGPARAAGLAAGENLVYLMLIVR